MNVAEILTNAEIISKKKNVYNLRENLITLSRGHYCPWKGRPIIEKINIFYIFKVSLLLYQINNQKFKTLFKTR